MTAKRAVHVPNPLIYIEWNDQEPDRDALVDLGYVHRYGAFRYANPHGVEGTRVLLVPAPDGRAPWSAMPGESVIVHNPHLETFHPVPASMFWDLHVDADSEAGRFLETVWRDLTERGLLP